MAATKGAKAASPYRPYKSYLFLTGSAASFTTDVTSTVSSAVASLDGVKNPTTMAKSTAHAVDFHSMTYVVEVEPSWHLSPAPLDVLNHVVVVAISSNWAAVCCSDASLREKIFREAKRGGGNLSPVDDRRIKDALVAGKAKTLWLSGTHRRTSVKADSKVLAGQDLGDALNPLDDQTYYFTSARMETNLSGGASLTEGVSPSSSRAWVGPSRDWAEFCEGTAQLLKHVATAKKSQNPLPILAQTATSLTGISGAFDVMIESDDTLAPATTSTNVANAVAVTVTTHVGKTVTIDASDDNGPIGTVDFKLSAVDKAGLLTSKVDAVAATGLSPGRAQLFDELTEEFRDGRRVKIYFDSGHTLADGRLVAV
jgi:hypothetical protein